MGCDKRPLDAIGKKADERFIDGDLDDECSQQRVIRCGQRHTWHRAHARGEIANNHRERRKRRTRGHEHVGGMLAREVEEMKKRALVEALELEVLEYKRPRRKGGGWIRMRQQFSGQHARPGCLRPDCREMTLTLALRADQSDNTVRPVGPPSEPIEWPNIRRAAQKVLTRQAIE